VPRAALLSLSAPADNAAMQAEPPKADPPKRKRRWFQFSLRTLMIVVAVVAAVCSVLADRQYLIHERNAAWDDLKGEMERAEADRVRWMTQFEEERAKRKAAEDRAERAEKLLHSRP
jgi:hypothetical protein